MTVEKDKEKFKIGGGLFVFCWIVVILMISISLIFNLLKSELNFILFLVLIGIILLPFLKSFNVGKIFGLELKSLNTNIEKLRETILNFNINTKQEINLLNILSPEGQNLQIKTIEESKKKSDLGYSLFMQQRLLEAIDAYKESLKIDPNNWIAAMYLGFIYLSLPEYKIDETTWGFDNSERLFQSIYYSAYATKIDIQHYNQFMNLAIAQKHLGGRNLVQLALKNMEKAYRMFITDPNVPSNPILVLNKAKARSFMGEFAEAIEEYEDAIKYRQEAIEIFRNCPEPKPEALEKWLHQAEEALENLNTRESQ